MILELKEIHKNFGGVNAITNTSFAIRESEIFGLIGPNGAGKTTLFNIITGNYKPSSGEVFFLGKKIDHLKPHKIVHLGIARTFQNIRLFSSMSVLENVLIGFDKSIKYNIFEAFLHLGRFSKAEKNAKKAAYEILEQLNIAHLADEKATSLSYGQQRKVEIARALATNPKLLLLDEPAAGMNSTESDDLAELIFNIRDNKKISVLLIEHDMKFVNKLCDRVMVLDYGRTIFEGKPNDAVQNPEVISAYLGDFNASS
ncbi:high-affinity branched-chain amino acid ABC transporter, ATP-binding protein [Campylobacter lari]|uniref:High-affinity branched-chain amino acid transporter, ATP-binding protein n=1 Tax=Campylobacter lari TaxID=201 RepID=A0A5L4JTY0_CAMLA|nr:MULTISPECIES: high-affinity branched-chain amino acid transporter, ATP-binding protein [Campylobacter]MCR8687168.1 high-affinity branched-chain amino acid transporter, ATP-binding protein [Campylobacter sp. 1569]AJD03639.1 high-affinity branched-chain amino acid transporter, ATP-binding protein [Campylobacter lari CCUG 22395]AJD05120.1 high-affinity branched-chain amino acid transporter, ATP-binding protein [Campylobacter lari RM16701]AKJ53843.1 leucine/isoleucine/valine transporter ATP-bind